ncbi:ParA family protein [Pasteurella atlantica]|uniref:ParA family protein n=2 Tax=Pasteurellaceae TaxID=712 RepID=A0ACC6HL43_9PAST|nr:ParA family protein [Pasteurella atlantica]MDP8051538.1 ParA family protein [Pasteurella atlantica]MDP8104883.1 ParA family protein [Pasteurella atlantica]MDP8148257.1 ParA family protein [Pasteurella atlantica]
MGTAKIISFISTKGSVGKTSLTIHMAGYLASLGKKILLIDADSQQSLSSFFNIEQHSESNNGFSLFLMGKLSADDVIHKTTNHKNIDIIINDDPNKLLVAHFLKNSSGGVFRLAFLLEPLKNIYDYIFIDTEGTDGRDHDGRSVQNAALLARPDLVLSVTKPKMLFAMETARVVDVFNSAIKEYENIGNPHRPSLVFIINDFDRSLATDSLLLKELQTAFINDENLKTTHLLKTVVPTKRKFFESYFLTKTFAHQYKDPNKYDHLNIIIQSLCEEVFPELVEKKNE